MIRSLSYLFFVTMITFGCRSKKNEVVSPIMAPITEAVFATGHVEPANLVVLTALNEGYLTKIFVTENEVVHEGQKLFSLDASLQEAQENAASRSMLIAKKNTLSNSPVVMQLKAQLLTAIEKCKADSLQFERMNRLHRSQSVSKIDFENAALGYESSRNQVAAILENIRSAELSLEQAYINAESQLKMATLAKSYYTLTATGKQRVYEITRKQGELIRKGDRIALLGRPDSLVVKLNIDEASILKIKNGQTVLVELNTQKGTTYTAYISKVYPYFNEQEQSYTVEARFTKMPTDVIAGTLLQANILVASRTNAMLIPRECLTLDGRVVLKRDDGLDTVLIKTGIISTEWVEALEGIRVSDKLLKLY